MSTAFSRLMWKEYRAQHPLWLALTGASLLLTLLIALLSSISIPLSDLMGVAIVLAVAFGVATLTVAFSGEEEDGTAMWLRMFPVSTAELLSSKLLVCVVGTLALLAVSALFNLLLTMIIGGSPDINLNGPKAWIDLLRGTVGCVTFILLTLNCSLRSTKVFTTLGIAAVGMFLFAVLAMNTEQGPLSPTPLLVTVLATIAVVPNIRAWHRGQLPSTDSSAEGRSRWSRLQTWSVGLIEGRPTVWQKRLMTASMQVPLSTRTFRVLLWRELRFALPFAKGCLAITTGLLLIPVLSGSAESPIVVAFGFLVVLEAGLRTFRHDQQQLNGLFWGHRGVSAASVWTARVPVWLGVLVGLILLMALMEYSVAQIFFSDTPSSMNSFLTHHAVARWQQQGRNDILRIVSAVVLAGFAQAQLFSAWIRKPVVAAFLALAGMIAVVAAAAYCEYLGIPQAMTVWPFVIICLLLTFVTRRQWMDRQSSMRIVAARTASLVVLCLCLWMGTNIWRATEVPDVGSLASRSLTSQDPNVAAIARMTPDQLLKHYGYFQGAESTEWAQAWQRFYAAASRTMSPDFEPTLARIYLPGDAQLNMALDALDQILAADSEFSRLPPQYRVPWSHHYLPVSVTSILVGKAQQEFLSGQPRRAAERAIQAVQLDRYLQHEATSWNQWLYAVNYENFALSVLQRFLSDDRLTDDDLQALQEQLSIATGTWSAGMNVMANGEVVWEQLLLRYGYLWDRYRELQVTHHLLDRYGIVQWPSAIIEQNRFERIRTLRLLRLLNDQEKSWQATALRQDGSNAPIIEHWLQTTPFMPDDLYMANHWLTGRDSPMEQAFRTCGELERATAVAIALQRYRRRHGKFPTSLLHLSEFGIPSESMDIRDWDSENLLGYAPEGLKFAVPFTDDSGNVYLLHPEQPVLWTPGPHSPLQQRHLQSEPLNFAQMQQPLTDHVFIINGGYVWGVRKDLQQLLSQGQEFLERMTTENVNSNAKQTSPTAVNHGDGPPALRLDTMPPAEWFEKQTEGPDSQN
ncbi:MAG: ABC-2 transporter permease [Planctomycetaceae bacterium]|nr:ABC-2 transporter permease [Planctomycetaceae bacterium]